jgi:hypothetical protein
MREHQMRTTLQLDDDVLAAARVLARQQRTSLGAVISELARQALVAPARETQGPTTATACPCCPGRRREHRWIWSS